MASQGTTKEKLRRGELALGGWMMIGHPAIAEIMAGEGFDWIGVCMEHTSVDIRAFTDIAMALKGTGVDLLARLPSHSEVQAKLVLDAGASGIIVPSVNTPEQARRAVAMAKFPPEGCRGASLCRATDYGRNFTAYFRNHNADVLVIVMLEHTDAVQNVDAIMATPGVDGVFIGPYDLSASMRLPGLLDHPQVLAAEQTILDACRRHHMPAGIHALPGDSAQIRRYVEQGFCFIACGMDTELLLHGSRAMLRGVRNHG